MSIGHHAGAPIVIGETFGEDLGPRRPTGSEPRPAQLLRPTSWVSFWGLFGVNSLIPRILVVFGLPRRPPRFSKSSVTVVSATGIYVDFHP